MTCSVPGCERRRAAKGYCLPHYKRWRRTGSPTGLTVEQRFFAKVTESGDCWEWHRVDPNGYGTVFQPVRGEARLPHRWAYQFLRADIPDGLELDHLCRNRRCVNPWHLEPVTRRVNAQRGVGSKEACVNGHPYTEENTYVRPDRGTRMCRACNNNPASRRRRSAAA